MASRRYSFDEDDEMSLNANENRYRDSNPSTHAPPAYTDSPERDGGISPPPPPAHRITVNTGQPQDARYGNRDLDHSTSNRTTSTTTPGADNLGEAAAGGGIAGVALGVANTNERESGVQALRSIDEMGPSTRGLPLERGYDTMGSDTPYIPAPPSRYRNSRGPDPFASPAPSARSNPFDDGRRGSGPPSPGELTLRGYPSRNSIPLDEYPPQDARNSYTDNPYNRFSTAWDTRMARGDIDPNEIEDDGDDGLEPTTSRQQQRTVPEGAAVGGAAATGGVMAALGGLVGRKNVATNGSRDPSGQYGPVGGGGIDEAPAEKSDWLNTQTSGRRRFRWIVGILIALVIIGAIIGGVIAGLRSSHSTSSSPSSGNSAAQDNSSGDLDANSAEIKKLMNNPGLHKVFPGMDYTPFNAQYPACLSNPPSQNNVTRDVAVLSQLTNTIRLYGTDCNQTEMVLHAFNKLTLKNMKLWLGVWLDGNSTTNNRGLSSMYDLISKNGADPFAGVIVGNEVLYRKDLSEQQLGDILTGVQSNFTSKKINLPIATSELGDSYNAGLAANVDVVMANIHPFFAGVTADVAAAWTWNFWQQHDITLTAGTSKKNVVSEVGWPSGGGTDCGNATSCTTGSVAGISEMNTFMDSFICQSLANGTNYFW